MKQRKALQIFEIIRKLDKEERRAFKLYAQTYERKLSVTMALFDIIYDYTHALPDGQEPDEAGIAARLKKEKLSAQYTNTKNRLKKLVMDFLHDTCTEDEDKQARRIADLSTILKSRGHLALAGEMLSEAKEMAKDTGSYTAMMDILYQENLKLSYDSQSTDKEHYALLAEAQEAAANYIEKMQSAVELHIVRNYHGRRLPVPDSIPTIEAVSQRIKPGKSMPVRWMHYCLLFALSDMQDPPAVTAAYMASCLAMLEEDMKSPGQVYRYFVSFGFYLHTLTKAGDTVRFLEQVQKMEAQYIRYGGSLRVDEQSYILLNIHRFKVNFFRRAEDKEGLICASVEAERDFLRYYKFTNLQGREVFSGLLRISFFTCGDYARAQHWATKDIGPADADVSIALPRSITELMSSYELGGKTDTIRNIIKKIKYYLSNKVTDPAAGAFMENLMLQVTALNAARSMEEKMRHILDIKTLCDAAMDSGTILRDIVWRSQIRYWIESKINPVI